MSEHHSTLGVPDKGRIGRAIVLPLSKAVEISLKSLRIRFWRSMLTVSSVILAIAFLAFVWTSSRVQSAVAVGMRPDSARATALLADIDTQWAPLNTALAALFRENWRPRYLAAVTALNEGDASVLKALVYEAGHFDESKDLAAKKIVHFKDLPYDASAVEALAKRARDMGLEPDLRVAAPAKRNAEGRQIAPPDKNAWPLPALKIVGLKAAVQNEVERYKSLNLALQRMGIKPETPVAELQRLDPQVIWLIVIALLVCGVGIINAMLMSVTERFREIGTMKCLGALDSFIVKLFLLESTFQGIAGTVFGVVIGLVVMVLSSLMRYGGAAFTYFPSLEVILIILWALLIGSALSVCAAVFPALRAAHMAPVEAMRVEE